MDLGSTLGWHAAFPRILIEGHERAPVPIRRTRYRFPRPDLVAAEGAATLGADFAPATVVEAYRSGYFPWPHEDIEYLWFSPDPRAVIPIGGLHVSRSLARTLRQDAFRVTIDQAFADVVAGCAERPGEDTWITPAYVAGYTALHELGWAHSFEVWCEGELAGGLYGVRIGAMFGAESMFHRYTDASKVAMAAMMQWAEDSRITLVDIQVTTPHTERMGGIEIRRAQYLWQLDAALAAPAALPPGEGIATLPRPSGAST